MKTSSGKETEGSLKSVLQGLAHQNRHKEILTILDAQAQERPLELWQLVLKSRALQLDEESTLPFEMASQPLEEALDREVDYLPALLDLAHFLDLHADESRKAIDTYRQASQIVLEHLLDALRGWVESAQLDDESRKKIMESYNSLVEMLHSHGLDAGVRARRIDWLDPDTFGDQL